MVSFIYSPKTELSIIIIQLIYNVGLLLWLVYTKKSSLACVVKALIL